MVSPFHVIIWKRIDCFIEMWRRSVSTEVKMNFVVELNAWYRKIIHRRRVSILYSPALVTMGILEPLHRRTWQFSVFCLVVEFKCVFWLIHPCDRQTDRQTELPWHYTRYSMLSRIKNGYISRIYWVAVSDVITCDKFLAMSREVEFVRVENQWLSQAIRR